MKAKVVWQNDLTFIGSSESGFEVRLDTFKEVGGNESGLRPMEMVAIGIAGCTAMDVISILKKKRLDVTGFEVIVYAARSAEHPKKFTDIVIEYVVTGNGIDEPSVERAVQLSEERYCAAIGTIRGNVNLSHKITVKSNI
jgi:putative redox protein